MKLRLTKNMSRASLIENTIFTFFCLEEIRRAKLMQLRFPLFDKKLEKLNQKTHGSIIRKIILNSNLPQIIKPLYYRSSLLLCLGFAAQGFRHIVNNQPRHSSPGKLVT